MKDDRGQFLRVRSQAGMAPGQRWIGFFMLCAVLCVSGGCRLLWSKGFVTDYRIEDTESNRIAVKKCVDSIAMECGLKPSTNPAGKRYITATYVYPKEGWLTVYPEKTDSVLDFEDIYNWESLAYRLKEPTASDEMSRVARTWLSPSTLTLLANYNGGRNHTLQEALRRDLSRACVRTNLLYDAEKIGNIKLSPDTLHLLEQERQGQELYRLNRMLLADAYPDAIRNMRKDRLLISFTNTGRRISQKHLEVKSRLTAKLLAEFGDDSVSMSSHSYWLP